MGQADRALWALSSPITSTGSLCAGEYEGEVFSPLLFRNDTRFQTRLIMQRVNRKVKVLFPYHCCSTGNADCYPHFLNPQLHILPLPWFMV